MHYDSMPYFVHQNHSSNTLDIKYLQENGRSRLLTRFADAKVGSAKYFAFWSRSWSVVSLFPPALNSELSNEWDTLKAGLQSRGWLFVHCHYKFFISQFNDVFLSQTKWGSRRDSYRSPRTHSGPVVK